MRLEVPIILGVIGAIAGGPVSSVLLFLVGLVIEIFQNSKYDDKQTQKTQKNDDFAQVLLILLAYTMTADGVAKKSQLSTVKQLLIRTYGEQRTASLLLQLRELIKNPVSIFEACKHARMHMAYGQRTDLLKVLFKVAQADGNLNKMEQNSLRNIGVQLGLNLADYNRIRAMFMYNYQEQRNEHSTRNTHNYTWASNYKILGVEPTADEQTVKRAFRKLAKVHHPDFYGNKSKEEIKRINNEFIKIKNAYEAIKKQRGWE